MPRVATLSILIGASAILPATAVAADKRAPTAPKHLVAKSTSKRVSLRWRRSTDNHVVKRYRVRRRRASPRGGRWSRIATTKRRSFSDHRAKKGVRYVYGVRAIDAAHNHSRSSNLVNARLRARRASAHAARDRHAPTVPRRLVAERGSDRVSLAWAPSTDNVAVKGYKVWRRLASTPGTGWSAIGTARTPSFSDTAARSGVGYVYGVRAFDAAGNGSDSSNLVHVAAAGPVTPIDPAPVSQTSPVSQTNPAPTPIPPQKTGAADPTPGTADGQPLWTSSASAPAAEWASYVEAGGGGTPVTSSWHPTRIASVIQDGRPAYRMTVLAGDRDRYTSGAQRTELGQGNPGRSFADGTGDRKMRDGEERWVAEQIWIPDSVRGGTTSWDFFCMNQMKGDGQGGPPLSLSFRDGRISLRHADSQTYGSVGGTDIYTSGLVARNMWLKVVWHVKWSASGDGFVELYGDLGDGQGLHQLMPRYHGWTLKRDASGGPAAVHPRMGIYRRALDRDTTLYFSGYSVATSRAAAEAPAGFGT